MLRGSDPDGRYFHYYCDKHDKVVVLEDLLISHDELENATKKTGTTITCIHCGSEHALFIGERRKAEKKPRKARSKTGHAS